MHADLVSRTGRILTDESKLLAYAQSSVDYDVDEYVLALSGYIDEKMLLLERLKDKLLAFQVHLQYAFSFRCYWLSKTRAFFPLTDTFV